MNSKAKGSAGERELAAILTAEGFDARRNDQRYTGGVGNPDVTAEGLEQYHIETKRTERLRLGEAMQQAIHDADGKIPLVMHRRSRQPWLVTMRLSDWLKQMKGGENKDDQD